MNTLKLSLDNFQAISEGVLEFKTGLNFIIGQSNSGKTATFRAVKDCLLNPSKAARHIKNGTNRATVTLEYNGNTIQWVRTPNSSTYEINGQEYIKVGRSSAFKILEGNTGFVVGTNGVIMNIEEELQVPFPFGMSKQDLFKLYEDVFCISDSAIILKAAKAQEEQAKFDIGSLEAEIIKNNNKIEELKKFKGEVSIDLLNSYKSFLNENSARLSMLRSGLPEIKIALKLQNFDIKESAQEFRNVLPEYEETTKLRILSRQLKALHKISCELPSNPQVSEDLLKDYNELNELRKYFDKITALDSITFEEFSVDTKISRYNELNELAKVSSMLRKLKDFKLPEFSFTVDFQEYVELRTLSEHIKELQKDILKAEETLKACNERVESISATLKQFKVCPLCHRPLD